MVLSRDTGHGVKSCIALYTVRVLIELLMAIVMPIRKRTIARISVLIIDLCFSIYFFYGIAVTGLLYYENVEFCNNE